MMSKYIDSIPNLTFNPNDVDYYYVEVTDANMCTVSQDYISITQPQGNLHLPFIFHSKFY